MSAPTGSLTGGVEPEVTATATDNSGVAPTILYSPAGLSLTSADVESYTVITATATDDAGNTASCRFMIYVEGEKNNCLLYLLEWKWYI